MQYTFLHLSDLHFRQGWDEEMGVLSHGLFEDLRKKTPEFENLYAMFSGDLVFQGEDPHLY